MSTININRLLDTIMPLNIDWSEVDEGLNYAARDEDGEIWLFSIPPTLDPVNGNYLPSPDDELFVQCEHEWHEPVMVARPQNTLVGE